MEKITKKDLAWGLVAGVLMGLLFLPILRAIKPELYTNYSRLIVVFFILATPIGLVISSYLSRLVPVIWPLSKFIVTGGLNALVDLGVLSLLTFLFLSAFDIKSAQTITDLGIVIITFYSVFKSISFITATINSYFWNKYWTFEKGRDKKNEFGSFFIVSLVGFFINVLVASYVFKSINPMFTLNIDQWGLVGAAAGSIAGLTWNFLGYKLIVFKK